MSNEPPRPITASFTVQEANEIAIAARIGNEPGRAYVDHDQVQQTIARIEAAAKVEVQ